MSIFEPVSQRALIFRNLWIEFRSLPLKLQSQKVIFEGELYIPSVASGLTKVHMYLTKNSFYYHSSQGTIFIAYIKWCLLQNFMEQSNSGDQKFGFSLKNSTGTFDFYTETEDDLNSWFSHLSFIAVLSDFDEFYLIVKNIDSGQFGSVDLCIELETKLNYAVKKIDKNKLKNPKTLNLVFNEIQIQKKLDHPNIVQLHKIVEDAEFVYLVLEYVKGGNLYKAIVNHPNLGTHEAMRFTRNLLEVINYIHSKGIIHRDLKPENILIMCKESICNFKIADFGLSCYIKKNEFTCTGSPGYLAPEILRGSPYDTKVDIFSIGVIVFILLTGYSPFAGNSGREVIRKNLRCEIPFNSAALRNCPLVAKKFLMKILKDDPNVRPSAEELLDNEWFRERKYSEPETTSTTIRNEICRESGGHFGRIADRYLKN